MFSVPHSWVQFINAALHTLVCAQRLNLSTIEQKKICKVSSTKKNLLCSVAHWQRKCFIFFFLTFSSACCSSCFCFFFFIFFFLVKYFFTFKFWFELPNAWNALDLDEVFRSVPYRLVSKPFPFDSMSFHFDFPFPFPFFFHFRSVSFAHCRLHWNVDVRVGIVYCDMFGIF